VGRLANGCTVFVPFTAPGDRVRIQVVEQRARHARARALKVERAGPARREPQCEVFGVCGGCRWQHLEYAAQLDAKRSILSDAIERIGRLPLPADIRVQPSPQEFGYRTRARVFASRGRAGFRRAGSHEMEPIERCPVLAPALQPLLQEAAGLGASSRRPVEIELTSGRGGHGRASVIGEPETAGRLEVEGGGGPLAVSPGVFVQANAGLLEPLCAAILSFAGRGERAAELFAGAGLFTRGLAERFDRLLAVESNIRASEDLAWNLSAADLRDRVEIVARPVERALPQLDQWRPEVVVLDPPRVGLAAGVAERLAACGAHRIVYLSCDPATLARDLRVLCAERYRLAHLEAYDLFPQTAHVEALAVLEATRSGARGPEHAGAVHPTESPPR